MLAVQLPTSKVVPKFAVSAPKLPALIPDTQKKHLRKGETEVTKEEEATGSVYMLTCRLSNRSYVGQAKNVKYKGGKPFRYGARGRFNDHVADAHATDKTYPIFDAIREHGASSFAITILAVCNLNDLDDVETETMSRYNTLVPNGYNVMSVGYAVSTEDRISDFVIKYGEIIQVPLEIREEIRAKLQADLDYKYQKKLDALLGKTFEKITIQTNWGHAAPRKTGPTPKYKEIKIGAKVTGSRCIYTSFGGVKLPILESYQLALDFVDRIPKQPYTQVIDLVNTETLEDMSKL